MPLYFPRKNSMKDGGAGEEEAVQGGADGQAVGAGADGSTWRCR